MLKEFRDFLMRGGKPDFKGLTSTINDAVFYYGAFITASITFLATAAPIFFFLVTPIRENAR